MTETIWALTTDQGTAMPETVLIGSEVESADNRDRAIAAAITAGDWDNDQRFKDCTDNEALAR